MNITGQRWELDNLTRLFFSGVLWGISLTGLWFFYIAVSADLRQTHMLPFLNELKTQTMYGFWGSLLFLVFVVLVYTDARIFSGRATQWWAYIGRLAFLITILINVSVMFWTLWFLMEPGTPSITFLYESTAWEWSVQRIRRLSFLAVPWYVSYYLRGEYGLHRTKVYGSIVLPYIVLLALSWFLASSFEGIALDVTGIFGSLSATIPILIYVYRDVEKGKEVSNSTEKGILREFLLRERVLFIVSGFAIGIFLSQGFILSRFPIGGNDPLFSFIKFVTIWVPIVLFLSIRFLRE